MYINNSKNNNKKNKKNNNRKIIPQTRAHLKDLAVITEPVYDRHKTNLENYKLLRFANIKKQEPIRIMSNKYTLVQHLDVFNDAVDILNDIGIDFDITRFDKNTGSGHNSIHITFNFPDIKIKTSEGNIICASLELFNGCDGLVSFSRMFGAFRYICSNGMILGKKFFAEKKKHTANFEMDNLLKQLTTANSKFYELEGLINNMKNYNMNKKIKQRLLKTGFPKKVLQNYNEVYSKYSNMYPEQFELSDSNLWVIYNTLTNWISNQVMKKSIYRGSRLQKKLFSIVTNDKLLAA